MTSIGATVWPLVTYQAKPRQTSKPPSVTMKEGTFEEGDDDALEGADGRADREAAEQA